VSGLLSSRGSSDSTEREEWRELSQLPPYSPLGHFRLLASSFQALQAGACSQTTHSRPFQFVIYIAVTSFVICQGNKCHAIQWQEIKSQPLSLIPECSLYLCVSIVWTTLRFFGGGFPLKHLGGQRHSES